MRDITIKERFLAEVVNRVLTFFVLTRDSEGAKAMLSDLLETGGISLRDKDGQWRSAGEILDDVFDVLLELFEDIASGLQKTPIEEEFEEEFSVFDGGNLMDELDRMGREHELEEEYRRAAERLEEEKKKGKNEVN